MTAEQRADVLMELMPFQPGHLGYNYRQALVLSIKEAMREAPLPAVPDSVSIGVISANGERHVVSVIGSEAGVKALIALTEPAVPDVDIAELMRSAPDLSPHEQLEVAQKLYNRIAALEREHTARKVLADGLKAAVALLDSEDWKEVFRDTSFPEWMQERNSTADLAAIRKALSLIQEKV